MVRCPLLLGQCLAEAELDHVFCALLLPIVLPQHLRAIHREALLLRHRRCLTPQPRGRRSSLNRRSKSASAIDRLRTCGLTKSGTCRTDRRRHQSAACSAIPTIHISIYSIYLSLSIHTAVWWRTNQRVSPAATDVLSALYLHYDYKYTRPRKHNGTSLKPCRAGKYKLL